MKAMAHRRKSKLKRPENRMLKVVRDAMKGRGLVDACGARPAYQRNDYVGLIASSKLDAARQKRLAQMLAELKGGKKYMNMPWPGTLTP